jgi:hypothetical protein
MSDNFIPMNEAPLVKEKSPSNPKVQVAKDVFEIGGKIVIGLAGLCYVLGLVVVTIHLREYGLNSLSLSQLHYVTAGVWAVLPILMTLLLIAYALYAFSMERERIAEEKVVGRIIGIFSLMATSVVIFYWLIHLVGSRLGINFGWESWVLAPLLGTLAVVLVACAVFVFTQRESYSNIKSLLAPLGLLVVGIMLSVWYLAYFTSHTYKEIPWSTGGGRPSQVQLMIVSEAKPYAEGAGIKFAEQNTQNTQSTQNKTETLKLLLVTEKDLIVINTNGQAISLPFDIVKSVVYEK